MTDEHKEKLAYRRKVFSELDELLRISASHKRILFRHVEKHRYDYDFTDSEKYSYWSGYNKALFDLRFKI